MVSNNKTNYFIGSCGKLFSVGRRENAGGVVVGQGPMETTLLLTSFNQAAPET
jgi:hypothetical protein